MLIQFFQNQDNLSFFFQDRGLLYGGKHRLVPGSGVNLAGMKLYRIQLNETIEFLFVARIMRGKKGIGHYLNAAKVIRINIEY